MFSSSNFMEDNYNINDSSLIMLSSRNDSSVSFPVVTASDANENNSSIVNGIDDEFFSKLVDDLFLDNEYFSFPNTITSPIPETNNKNDYESSPFDDDVETITAAPILTYPAPAPLAIIPNNNIVSNKRFRDYSVNQFSIKKFSVSNDEDEDENEKSNKRRREENHEASNPKKNYIGVTYHAPSKRFRARIKIDNKTTHLGYFITEYEAAVAYDRAAWELRGVKAHLNFDVPDAQLYINSIKNNLPIRDRCIAVAKSAAGVVPAL